MFWNGRNTVNRAHASLYDVTLIESAVRNKIIDMGIKITFRTRVVDEYVEEKTIKYIKLDNDNNIMADSFIETTWSTGPMGNCLKYGNGCSMCVLRSPSFGGRVSITKKMWTLCRSYRGYMYWLSSWAQYLSRDNSIIDFKRMEIFTI